jgi:tRNA-2-methylthio-N6-dimethylallyladenosine synthase
MNGKSAVSQEARILPPPPVEPAAHIVTFGCQMNEADSEKMAGVLRAEGYRLVSRPEDAYVIVINTCSIRAKAEQKVFSLAGRLRDLKRERPGLLLVMAGCIAQKWGEALLERESGLDVVMGTGRMARLPALLRSVRETGVAAVDVSEEWGGDHPALPVRRSSLKAWINIMFGCDNYCAYCVVPYVRGREWSRPLEDVVREASSLAESGYREVTLLGQNGLLRDLDRRSGIPRIRFTTSHPKDFTPDLIAALRELPSVCEAVHLPLQAGADDVLRRMNRGYRYDDYRRLFFTLKEAVPEVAVTTDIIVGFPGETPSDHRRTLAALEELRYDGIFSFCFSPREGTAAWDLTDDVPRDEKTRRLVEVQKLQQEISTEKNRALVGKRIEVLVEGVSRKDSRRLTGRTRGNKIVNFTGPETLAGRFVHVKIIGAGFVALTGELDK